MLSDVIKIAAASTLAYVGYKIYTGADSACTPKAVRGASSSAVHDAVDPTEEASMDSFPASDAPARNDFR